MLKISCKSPTSRRQSTAQKVFKKYRKVDQQRKMRKREYKKLKAIVPAIAEKAKVPKITVIEEAIKYIDELHLALAKRMCSIQGMSSSPIQHPFQMLLPFLPHDVTQICGTSSSSHVARKNKLADLHRMPLMSSEKHR